MELSHSGLPTRYAPGSSNGSMVTSMGCRRPRRVLQTLSAVVIVFTSGCSGYVRESAVNAIAREMQPENATVAAKLETSANPTGEGVIVFVRADSNCAPRYAWLWVNERIPGYALDTASQALTPRLATLSSAAAATLKRTGSSPQTFSTAVRETVCQTARK
jgi:hypothetical protein